MAIDVAPETLQDNITCVPADTVAGDAVNEKDGADLARQTSAEGARAGDRQAESGSPEQASCPLEKTPLPPELRAWALQLFTEEVGLTPKLFCRVRRFQEVLRLVAGPARVEWANVALACGYYDQAHFIHDFRAFCGLSPTAYLARRTEHLNHVPLPD